MSRKPIKPKTSVFAYADFRRFLRAVLSELREKRSDLTMRHIAEMLSFGSPSFLKMIMDGKRNLSDANGEKICELFHLKDRERDYFLTLVKFNQSDDPDEKKKYFSTLDDLRPRVTFSQLEQKQHKYLSRDHYACIREMVLLKDFKENAKWIAARCFPRIKPQEAREAIDTLLALGLLKRGADGRLAQVIAVVDTGKDTQAAEAFSFHEAILNKARRYLSHHSQENRNFTALTIPITGPLEKIISQKIDELQNEVLKLVNEENLNYDSVCQLNVQFFPVTTKSDSEKGKK